MKIRGLLSIPNDPNSPNKIEKNPPPDSWEAREQEAANHIFELPALKEGVHGLEKKGRKS
jgi:hypothetical protein